MRLLQPAHKSLVQSAAIPSAWSPNRAPRAPFVRPLSSFGVVEFGHGIEQLPTAPLARTRASVDDFTADDRIEHTRTQDVLTGQSEQVAGDHHHVGQLARRQRAELVLLEYRVGVVPGVRTELLHTCLR